MESNLLCVFAASCDLWVWVGESDRQTVPKNTQLRVFFLLSGAWRAVPGIPLGSLDVLHRGTRSRKNPRALDMHSPNTLKVKIWLTLLHYSI